MPCFILYIPHTEVPCRYWCQIIWTWHGFDCEGTEWVTDYKGWSFSSKAQSLAIAQRLPLLTFFTSVLKSTPVLGTAIWGTVTLRNKGRVHTRWLGVSGSVYSFQHMPKWSGNEERQTEEQCFESIWEWKVFTTAILSPPYLVLFITLLIFKPYPVNSLALFISLIHFSASFSVCSYACSYASPSLVLSDQTTYPLLRKE